MKNGKTHIALENRFRKMIQKDKNIKNAYMLIHSEKQGIHVNMAEGSTGSFPAHPEQPYFIASIDKMFTSVIIGSLEEQEKLSYEDSIASYLDPDLLHNLHLYKGKDYTNEIKIKHLLNHTSGLFGDALDRGKQGSSMMDFFLDEQSQAWTPQYIIQWTKENLTCHFPPGEGFYYSDVGYYLLILIIERITSKPYHEVLKDSLFQPLEMNQTYTINFTEPVITKEYPVADCFLQNKNMGQNIRLGMDDAGGRIVATTEDLLKFMKALVNYKLLRKETMEKMKNWAKFSIGIDYGFGIINFKHVPLLMPRRYSLWGNAGSNGSFMFYHPELNAYFIGSLNHFRYHRKGIMLMFKMIDILLKSKSSKSI
ncbi:serine hydrolase domain-containing protein [Gracilibacillus sp. S3-1-1]|uniref:Serine hydrolase domain-containing protein n=1 Tax=Gracilibacillus pellucidus TaxID=3095368 RepID=A0ACC6M8K5_9BACI|nr:serine hydrolase domain-containing protein [Gracilibacillus sp. S3-1-1]MDX8047255.1 serine hydrolase domain-containing protein [Gracilibacillus sp. S3-1-1]